MTATRVLQLAAWSRRRNIWFSITLTESSKSGHSHTDPVKTAAKDARRWRRGRRFPVDLDGPWRGTDIRFVWQRHELFQVPGLELARALGAPSRVRFGPFGREVCANGGFDGRDGAACSNGAVSNPRCARRSGLRAGPRWWPNRCVTFVLGRIRSSSHRPASTWISSRSVLTLARPGDDSG
jgi:hypothetical protein